MTGGEESYCFLQSNRCLEDDPTTRSLIFHGERETWPVRCGRSLALTCPFRENLSIEQQVPGRLVPCPFCKARHRAGTTAKSLCEEWHSAKLALKQMRDLNPSGKKFFESGTTSLPYSLDTPEVVRRLIWSRMKQAVMRRDDYSCQDCGVRFGGKRRRVFEQSLRRGQGGHAWEYLEVHHIIPRSRRGGDHPGNLKTLCPACHRKYTSELMVDLVEERRREKEQVRLIRECPDEADRPWDIGGD